MGRFKIGPKAVVLDYEGIQLQREFIRRFMIHNDSKMAMRAVIA